MLKLIPSHVARWVNSTSSDKVKRRRTFFRLFTSYLQRSLRCWKIFLVSLATETSSREVKLDFYGTIFFFFFFWQLRAAQHQCHTSTRPLFSAALPGNHPVGAMSPWGERKWIVTCTNCLSFSVFCSHKKRRWGVIFHSHGSPSFLRLRLPFPPVFLFSSS